MEEYKVIEKDGKKVRVLPEKYNRLANIEFIRPLIYYKTTERLEYSKEIAEKAIDLCNYRRPTIFFSKEPIVSAMSVKILQKFYDRSLNYRIMEGTDIIASYLGDSSVMDADTFTKCDLLIINLSLLTEQAMRTLQYLDVQLVERARLGKNTLVFFEGTKQRFVNIGGILKHFENVVDTVSMHVSRGVEDIKGKSFNDVAEDRSVKSKKRVDPYC